MVSIYFPFSIYFARYSMLKQNGFEGFYCRKYQLDESLSIVRKEKWLNKELAGLITWTGGE